MNFARSRSWCGPFRTFWRRACDIKRVGAAGSDGGRAQGVGRRDGVAQFLQVHRARGVDIVEHEFSLVEALKERRISK